MKMIIVLLAFMLLSCTPTVMNPYRAYAVVVKDKELIKNKEVLGGRMHELYFTFVQDTSRGLKPRLYVYGPIDYRIHPNLGNGYSLMPNTSYSLKVRFRRPGEAVMLFVWEGKEATSLPFVINLKYSK